MMNTDKIKTIDDIELISKKIIDGEIEVLELQSLAVLDRILVLEFANIYSLIKTGMLSQKTAAILKYQFLNEYRQFKTDFYFISAIHEKWIDNANKFSILMSRLAKELGDTNGQDDAFELALEIIDNLTNENVYLNLYYKSCNDKISKAHALRAGNKIVDSLIKKYGSNVPYAQQIEAFYRITNRDKLKQMWEQLNPDDFGKRARHLPRKDEKLKGFCSSLNTIYNDKS